ncbi:MAG: DMT family transporter [Chitinophagaceae bacterium]|nr:DMT family transporter [Chitinophagaceae bacterium]
MSRIPQKYKGIIFMLLAAFSFSLMGGFAKVLKSSFNAPQLVFYRNLIGLLVLSVSFIRIPVVQTGGRLRLLILRGVMGTLALYTLLYNILHIPLGAAMTYNTINTFYIAILSGWLLKEKLGPIIWICIIAGFGGILLIYKPSVDFSWKYHMIGLLHGIFSAIAYMSIGSLNKHYDTRVIVLSFLLSGLILPIIMISTGYLFHLPKDDFFFPEISAPHGIDYLYLLALGITALAGQYFVTKAYSNDKAGIVAAIGYSNIIFSVIIGIVLGDAFPDLLMWVGIGVVIVSGVVISVFRKS